MKLILGDSLEKLKDLEENSVDSIVTDPPYGISFMSKKWDYDVPSKELWQEALRVLKPGGYLLSFAGTRTQHRMAVNIEDAGFEIRDMIAWVYASGFPKSLNIQKALQKKCTCGNMVVNDIHRTTQESEHDLRPVQETNIPQEIPDRQAEGEVLQSSVSEQNPPIQQSESTENVREGQPILEGRGDVETNSRELSGNDLSEMSEGISTNGEERRIYNATQISNGSTPEQATDEDGSSTSHRPQSEQQPDKESCAFCKQLGTQEARRYYSEAEGLGSALKPAFEPITIGRKPLGEKTLVDNFIKYGTGGINIDGSRVAANWKEERPESWFNSGKSKSGNPTYDGNLKSLTESTVGERLNDAGRFPANLIHDNSEEVRECFPETKSGGGVKKKASGTAEGIFNINRIDGEYLNGDSGNASRFFKSIIYQAKSSKSERNKGLDSIVLVDILRVWNENNTTKEEKLIRLMVTGISHQKVIGESGVQLKNANEWNTCLFGKHLMEKYQEDIKSITKTETNSITTSQISNWLTHLLTNEYIADVKSETENGGNLVANVENSNTLIFTINEAMALALGVKDVVSGTQLKINVKEGSNIHSTVKPIALMEYLIKMVTPKGGVVLDPFMGSGSTGKACKLEGFDFIGIEREEEYIEIAKARIEAAKPESKLF